MPDIDVDGPDGKTYSFPDGTDKAAAIKYFKAKGIGVQKDSPSVAPPPGTTSYPAWESPEMTKVRTLTGTPYTPKPGGIEETARDFVGGAVQQVANVSAPVIAHRVAQKMGIAGERSRLYPEEGTLKDTARDATLMIGTGAAEGMEAEPMRPSGTATKELPQPPKDALSPEQAEAVDKANRTYRDAKAQVDRKSTLESTSKDFTRRAHENIQSTYRAARGSLDQRWGKFRQGMEGAELEPSEVFNDVEKAKGKYLKGSPSSLRQFNDLVKEMGIQEFMEGGGGELHAIPGTGKLPFDTGRVHYSAIGDKLAQGGLPGNVYQALKSVQESLDGQLTKAAETRKLGGDYSALKSDERQFRSDWVDPKSPLAKARGALDPNYLEPIIKGKGNEYLTGQLKRYTEHGADPNLPSAAKHFAERAAEITKKVPEVRELPKKSPPKAGKVARAVGRVTGKVIGGAVGSKLGHPLVGYGIGGELGTEAVERMARRRAGMPPPPE